MIEGLTLAREEQRSYNDSKMVWLDETLLHSLEDINIKSPL